MSWGTSDSYDRGKHTQRESVTPFNRAYNVTGLSLASGMVTYLH